jgi:PAS domain S-box-containing protein
MRQGRDDLMDEAAPRRGQTRGQTCGMHARVHELDWAATPLGVRTDWSASLQWAVDLVLASGFPMALRWGSDLILIYNDAYARMLGDKHPAALGRPLREVWPEIFDKIGPLNEAILRGESEGFFAADHPWTIRRNGRIEEVRSTVSYSPIPDPAAPNGVGGVLAIVNEKPAADSLRESQLQLRSLVAGVTDYALIMLDAEGIVSTWNVGAERIKGYAAKEIIGWHYSQFYTPVDRFNGLPDRSLSIAAETGRFEAEAWRVRKDGSQFWANVVINAIRDENGELIGFANVTRDVTERRNAQEALERAQRQVAQAQKMEALGELTGGVAHDFNNLLMIVSGQAQLLMRRVTGERNIRSLEAILTAAARGEALTRQLLTFSRRQPLAPRTIDLSRTVASFREILTSSTRDNIALRIDIPADAWPVAIDITEFELALVNLVVNARDAMPESGTVTISAGNVVLSGLETDEALTGEFVALSVADAGAGISADTLSRMFEPFFTTKGQGKGTGLGLPQVYGFAHQSAGAVSIDSAVGAGTTVTIYLPRSHAATAAVAAGEPPAQALGRGETVLVVEDNPEVKAVTVALLEQLNYRTRTVDDVRAALDLIATGAAVDLVFTDVMLTGDLDGLALARMIAEQYPRIPVVLTSGYAKALTGRHELPILRKPYQMAALAQVIRENLDK